MHPYAIRLYHRWWINQNLVRTVEYQSTRGEFPTSISNVELGVWDGGCSELGVRNWAGGPVPNGNYSATMDSFKACNFDPNTGTFVAISEWKTTYVLNSGEAKFRPATRVGLVVGLLMSMGSYFVL